VPVTWKLEKSKAIAATPKSYHLEVNYKDVVAHFGLRWKRSLVVHSIVSPKKNSFVITICEVNLAPDFEARELAAPIRGANKGNYFFCE